jgi:hypothetical protein
MTISLTAAAETGLAAAAIAPPDSELLGFDWAGAAWDESHMGTALDLTGYTQTFNQDFADLSAITDGVIGTGPFYAPAYINNTAAQYRSPLDTTPVADTFTISSPSILQIKMQKVGGVWYSGHMQTVNTDGRGFAQTYGYFEAKMAFNKAVGWPAFWLYSQNHLTDTAATTCEIDVVEAYGDNDYAGHHMTVHRHNAYRPQPRHLQADTYHGDYVGMASGTPLATFATPDLFTGAFHRYGVKIDPSLITIYFDGLEMARHPTYPEAKVPLYMLVSLQQQIGFEATSATTYLWVDWVKAWAGP